MKKVCKEEISRINNRMKDLEDNQTKKKYLRNDNKQQIIGGGCRPSICRPTTCRQSFCSSSIIIPVSPVKILSKKVRITEDEDFLNDYNKYTNKEKIAKNIDDEKQNQMQVKIFYDCILKHKIFIRENIQRQKMKLLDLIDIFQIYVLSGASKEEGLMQIELKELGECILNMKKYFEIVSQKQPSLDLVFYFDVLYNLNSFRKGVDKQNDQLENIASFITQIVKIGASAFKGDFAEVLTVSYGLGNTIYQFYQNSKSRQLFSHILEIYTKRVQKFEKELWEVTLIDDLEFYIYYFCELSQKEEQQTDFVLLILVKINYYFNLTEKEKFDELRQKFPLNCDLIQKFLPKMIQKIDSKNFLEDTIIKEFYTFSIQNPTFRFLTISILLKYYQIIQDKSEYSNNIIDFLIYKYLCEKNKQVKLAFETNTNFEEIYNKKIDDQVFMNKIQDMSKIRREEFQKVIDNLTKKNQEEKNISNLESIEERIDNQGDIERLVANNIIVKWEREVRQRQEENIVQKDDVLLEVKDLYVQQSITYEKGHTKLQGIFPQKQSSSLFDGDNNSQQQKALYIIVNHFLKSGEQDKQIEIKQKENNIDQEQNDSHNKFKILGILAEGGTGKSMLLKKLETDLISSQDISNYGDIDYIPLLIKCNSLDPVKPSIDQYLQALGIDQKQIDIIKESNRNKVILLDGYDEYTGQYFRVYSELNLKDWKNTKVIVTTRREKLTLNEACYNFSVDNESGQIDEYSYCLMKLEEFNKQDIIDYCKRYFRQRRIKKEQVENEQQVNKDIKCIQDCMKNQQLENLLNLPINLYLFTRMIADIESEEKIQNIKQNISDQVGIQEIFFKEQFMRESRDFVQSYIGIKDNNESILELITNCYFEYFQSIAMKMFLNKGKKQIINFLQLQKDYIQFTLCKFIQKELSTEQQNNLNDKIVNYVNSKIITRLKDTNTNTSLIQKNQIQIIEFKHKSLFEYFVARAMKYDFDIHQKEICILSMQELKDFSINQKTVMNIGQNQSEQQILVKLYKFIKNEIESTQFQSNYYDDKIENNNRFIQFLKRSTIKKIDEVSQIDIGASNLLSALFISKFSYPKLRLSLCSFSKAYIYNPKSKEINFDRCNLKHANLQNSCINYDSCNTQAANFQGFSKIFDTENIYSFNKIIWGKNELLLTISNSGFINSFNIVNSKIQLLNSKQLSQTPLFQIKKINEETLLVSSQYCLFMINSNNFEIRESHKFKDSIECITTLKQSIVITFKNQNLYHGNFKDGFKQLNIIGQGSGYNQKDQILITYKSNSFYLWDAQKDFEFVRTIQDHTSDITCVSFSYGGKYLATGSKDKTCKIWNTEKGFELINTIKSHTDSITFVGFSADEKYLATGSQDKICKLWNTEKGFELISTINSHTAYIQSIAFSADGKYIATGSKDKTCKIWNIEKGFELINSIQGHIESIVTVSFSEDGKYLATGSGDKTCKIWNIQKGFELIKTIQDHTNSIIQVAFSTDGKYLATCSSDKTCKIWNAEKGFELINTIKGHTEEVRSVAFSPNGKYLATCSWDKTCKIWNTEKGFEYINTIQGHTDYLQCVAFSADGKYLATGSKDRTCKIWNTEKEFELINTMKHNDSIFSVAFSVDGKFLATGSLDKTCKVWNAEKDFEIINTIQGHSEYVRSVAFSANGKYLATGSFDKTCKIWNTEKNFELTNTIYGHTDFLQCVVFSSDGKYLATSSKDKTFKIWNTEQGFELINTNQGHVDSIITVAFSADGKFLATGASDKTCKIWSPEKGFGLINTIQGHTDQIRSVAFSTDGKLLATGSWDKTCKIWNTEKGFELISTIKGHTDIIQSVAFSVNGKYLATGSKDLTCKIWNTEKGFELLNTIQAHIDSILTIAFSSDGKYLATGSLDKTCKIWNAEKGYELINKIQGHNDYVRIVVFSADGKFLATGSFDKTCKIWNIEKGFELISTVSGHSDNIQSIAFSLDGKYLATGSGDKTCKIWNIQKGFELITKIQSHTDCIASVAFSADGKYLATGSKDNTCQVWNTKKGFELINKIQGHTDYIQSVAFSADGKYLATGSGEKTFKIWNIQKDYELIHTIQNETSAIRTLNFSLDSQYISICSTDNIHKLWKLDNIKKPFFKQRLEQVNRTKFSKDSKYIFIEQIDKNNQIYDLTNLNFLNDQNKDNYEKINQYFQIDENKIDVIEKFNLFENIYCL